MKLKLLSVVIAFGVAALAAGCGGSNSDKKANEAYASTVSAAAVRGDAVGPGERCR